MGPEEIEKLDVLRRLAVLESQVGTLIGERCYPCDGTGRRLDPFGMPTWERCFKCGGKGYWDKGEQREY